MYLICVPEELSLLHLIEFESSPYTVTEVLGTRSRQLIYAGNLEAALDLAETAYSAARGQRDRYGAALATLFRAEILRRQSRWEDALDALQAALHDLALEVTPTAAYNEGLASYAAGLIHYMLRSAEKTLRAFGQAHQRLVESQRFWGFTGRQARASDCQNVIRWMAQLQDVQDTLPPDEFAMLVPVYERVNHALVRTQVLPLVPFQVSLPADLLAPYLPSAYIPLELDALPFLQFSPHSHYIALRYPEPADHRLSGGLHEVALEGKPGDLLLVELTTLAPVSAGLILSQDRPFVRRTDGRVLFRPQGEEIEECVGIPRLLIRKEREESI